MKKMILSVVVLCALSLILSSRLWADDNIKEGQWEIATTMKDNAQASNSGASDQQGRSTVKNVITRCVTNANPIPDIHEFAKNFEGCVDPQVQKNASTVDYGVSCNSQAGQINMHGHVVFTGDTMEGDASIQTVIKGKEVNVQTHIAGKYVSPC